MQLLLRALFLVLVESETCCKAELKLTGAENKATDLGFYSSTAKDFEKELIY